jgi:hypothetical protein
VNGSGSLSRTEVIRVVAPEEKEEEERESAAGTGFSLRTTIFLCLYHSTNATSPSTCCSYNSKLSKPGKLPKSYAVFGKLGAFDRKLLFTVSWYVKW